MLGGGLGRLKDGTLKQFRKRDGLSSDSVLSLLADADGTLWMGKSDNGLCRLKEGKFSAIGMAQGLLGRIISQIAEDEAGNLWLGSHHGILRVRKADLQRCAEGQVKSVACLSYGRAEGLASPKCTGGFQPAVCKSRDGRLWFPTVKGLAIIDPANVTTNALAPPVVIEEFLAEGQPIKLPSTLGTGRRAKQPIVEVPAGKQRFEIHYTALSFTAPDKVRFRHKLEGLERDWTDPQTSRVAPYSYLPPGAYTFRVIACNNDEVWNTTGASLAFTVLPHIWQTWWFQGSALGFGAAAVAAGVLGVTRRHERRKLERLERQRAIERERARIA